MKVHLQKLMKFIPFVVLPALFLQSCSSPQNTKDLTYYEPVLGKIEARNVITLLNFCTDNVWHNMGDSGVTPIDIDERQVVPKAIQYQDLRSVVSDKTLNSDAPYPAERGYPGWKYNGGYISYITIKEYVQYCDSKLLPPDVAILADKERKKRIVEQDITTKTLAEIDAKYNCKADVNTISDTKMLDAGDDMEKLELPIWKAVQAQKCWYSDIAGHQEERKYKERVTNIEKDTKKFDAQEKLLVQKYKVKGVKDIDSIASINNMKDATSYLFRNAATIADDGSHSYDYLESFVYENSIEKHDIYTESSDEPDAIKIAVMREVKGDIKKNGQNLRGCYYKVVGQKRFHTVLGVERDLLVLQYAECPSFFRDYLKKYGTEYEE
jgi:hypothetical protein